MFNLALAFLVVAMACAEKVYEGSKRTPRRRGFREGDTGTSLTTTAGSASNWACQDVKSVDVDLGAEMDMPISFAFSDSSRLAELSISEMTPTSELRLVE